MKTIAVSLTDPRDSSKAFIFLLRANANKSYYEANVGSLGVSGDFPLAISILDYQNQSLKQIAGSLVAAVGAVAISGDQFGQLSFWLFIIILIILLIIALRQLTKRDKRNNSGGNNNLSGNNGATTVASSAVVVLIVLMSTLFSGSHQAHAFNQQINYQGKLANGSNVTVADGQYPMVFKLYTTSSTTTPIWTETDFGANQPTTSGGLFSIMLGSTTPFTGVDFTQTLYLGVTVASDTEMTPRKVLGAVPAAFIAGTSTVALSANTLQGITPGQFFRNDQQNSTSSASTFFSIIQTGAGKVAEFFASAGQSALAILSNGNVGIGSSTPSTALVVNGTATIGNLIATTTATSTFGGGIVATCFATSTGGSCITPGTGGTGTNYFSNSGATTTLSTGNILAASIGTFGIINATSTTGTSTFMGMVGIGTTSPLANLTVQANLANSATSTLFVVASSSGTLASSTLFAVTGNGSIGIGTSTPQYMLTLASSTGLAAAIGFGGRNGILPLSYGLNTGGTNVDGLVLTAPVFQVNSGGSGTLSMVNGGFVSNWNGPNAQTVFTVQRNNTAARFTMYDNVGVTNDFNLNGNGNDNINVTSIKNFGVGTTSPWAKVSIQNYFGSTTPLLDIATTTSAGFATSSMFTVLSNGFVGIGTSTLSNALEVNGNGFFAGNLTISSLLSTSTATSTFGGGVVATCFATSTGGPCITPGTGGTGTNYFSNSGATTTLSTGNILAASIGTFGIINATSTTGTSTFMGNLAIGTTSNNLPQFGSNYTSPNELWVNYQLSVPNTTASQILYLKSINSTSWALGNSNVGNILTFNTSNVVNAGQSWRMGA